MSEVSDSVSSVSSEHIRNKVCRLCLEEHWKLAHLENLYFDDIYFLDIIRDCLSLDIDLSQDHLPLLICRKCVTTTLNFHTFKNSIIENEVFLQNVNLDELKLRPILNDNGLQFHEPRKHTREETSTSPISKTNEDNSKESSIPCMKRVSAQYAKSNSQTSENSSEHEMLAADNHIKGDGNSIAESGYACSICSSYFGGQNLRSREEIHVHQNANASKQTNDEEKKYACSACNKKFSKPGDYREHIVSHYTTQKYPCLQCNECFDSKHEVVVHTYTHVYKKVEEKEMKVRRLIKLYNDKI